MHHLSFIEGIGGSELMMVFFVILLLFGANKLPEFAKGLGKFVRKFKKATSVIEEEFRRAIDTPDDLDEVPKKKPTPSTASAANTVAHVSNTSPTASVDKV